MEDTVDYEDDGYEIKASVVNPQVRGTTKYVVYTLKGQDKHGTFEVQRRYSDFNQVRVVMLNRWPGCYIPAIPSKKMVGNMDAHFIEDRRVGLEEFLHTLSKIKHLWYSEEAQILVRGNVPEIEKAVAPLAKPSTAEIIARYEINFKSLSGKEINVSIVAKINQFSQYLKRIIPMLRNFKDMSCNMSSVRKKYNEQAHTLLQFMLPEYEKNCLKEYLTSEENLIFYNGKEQSVSEAQIKLKDFGGKVEFDQLYQSFRKEKREVEAFSQAIKVKEDYENAKDRAKQKVKDLEIDKQKVMAGKSTLSSLLKSKSKEENLKEIELAIEAAQKEQAEYTLICDISTVLLGYIEIDKFKKLRERNYYKQLKKMAQFELDYAKQENELWRSIVDCQPIQKLAE